MSNGVELATAYVSLAVEGSQIAPSSAKALGVVEDQADGVGRRSGSKMGSGIGGGILSAAKTFAGPIAAAFSAAAVFDFVKDSVAEARESQKVGALTANTIKATGGAAKISADQVGDLATAISNKTGIDDEAIQTGSNLLLTFKNIRNEVGKGNDIFNQATQAAVDLSAAGFGSVDSASKMLGKALNDPIKGITALSRAGVTFTEGQKKQIETMVKAGDTLGAQKMIMGEINSQVGGAAASQATASEKLSVAWGNLKESLGAKLLPILDRFSNWFLEKGLPAIQNFGNWLQNDLWPAIQRGADIVMPAIRAALDQLSGKLGDNSISWQEVGKFVTEKVVPALAFLATNSIPQGIAAIGMIIDAVKAAYAAFEKWVSVALAAGSMIVGALAWILQAHANMLRGLSHVPGFGWAKDAADKMQNAADRALGIRNAIDSITPYKEITVRVNTVGALIPDGNGNMVNPGLRAKGGPVTAGQPYIVGENQPELFVPNVSGTIVPSVPKPFTPEGGTAAGPGFDVRSFIAAFERAAYNALRAGAADRLKTQYLEAGV